MCLGLRMGRYFLLIALATFVIAAVVGYEILAGGSYQVTKTNMYTGTKTMTITKNVTEVETLTKLLTTTTTLTKTVVVTKQLASSVSTHSATPPQFAKAGASKKASKISIEIATRAQRFPTIESFVSFAERISSLAEFLSKGVYGMAYSLTGSKLYTTVATATLRSGTSVAAPMHSTTNVQVSGIDELDVAKTDGRAIYFALGNKIYIVDAKRLRLANVIELNNYVRGIYVWNGRLVAVSIPKYVTIFRTLMGLVSPLIVAPRIATSIYIYNVSNIYKPRLLANLTISGTYLSSRLFNGVLYIVTQQPLYIGGKVSIPVIGRNVVEPKNVEVLVNGDTYLTILALNLSNLRGKAYVYLVNRASMLYMSRNYLVVASNMFGVYKVIPEVIKVFIKEVPKSVANRIVELLREGKLFEAYTALLKYVRNDLDKLQRLANVVEKLLLKEGAWVRVFVFKVRGLDIEREGYVDVPGYLSKQFAINQMGKYLVLATVRYRIGFSIVKTGYVPQQKSTTITVRVSQVVMNKSSEKTFTVVLPPVRTSLSMYILLPRIELEGVGIYIVDLQKLKIAASIPNVISGEYVYGARLVGTTLFLVTNRVVDPLFAIDLSNPLKPKVVGFVKLPGYLTYLHPISKSLLLGMGVEKGSLKIVLFNVSNLRNIVEVSKTLIKHGWSPALYNYHAITFWSSRNLVMFPILIDFRNIGVAVVKYSNSSVNVVAILKAVGAERVLWIGNYVYVLTSSMVKVFNANGWKFVGIVSLGSR